MNEWLLYQWAIEDFLLIVFFIWNRDLLFKNPITGNNGMVQIHELAQVVLIYSLVYIVRVESRTQGTVIESSIVWAIIVAVASLAGIKQGTFNGLGEKIKDVFKETKGKKEEDI